MDFLGREEEVMGGMEKSGIGVIVVIVKGKGVKNEWRREDIGGIIDVWEGGMYGGEGLGEILLGKVNGWGKVGIRIGEDGGEVGI